MQETVQTTLTLSGGFEATPPHHVPLLVMLVFDDEDHVKTGQDGGHEVNVVLPFGVIPATEHRVGSSQHRAARVQGGGDAGLVGEGGSGCYRHHVEECVQVLNPQGHTLAMEMVCCSMAS